jgi:hypothetical protein
MTMTVGMNGGYYPPLNAREEALAKQYGKDAENGNFWRGATLWTGTGLAAGGATTAYFRDAQLKTSKIYTGARADFLSNALAGQPERYGSDILNIFDVKKFDAELNTGLRENINQGFSNPFLPDLELQSQSHQQASIALNKRDQATGKQLIRAAAAEEVGLKHTSHWKKGAGVAAAIITAGLAISAISAQGEGKEVTASAKQQLAQLKAQEAIAQQQLQHQQQG